MPEQKKRVIVEGVDFSQLFQFHRILGAATAALQPARLVIGLLMVTALITFGRIWDGAAPPTVSPMGLAADPWRADMHGSAHQARLHNAMVSFSVSGAPQPAPGATNELNTATVMQAIQTEYQTRRLALESEDARRNLDQQYARLVGDLNETRPRGVFEATVDHVLGGFNQTVQGIFSLEFDRIVAGLNALMIQTPTALWRHHRWFAIVYGLFAVLVFAIGGGAVARIAAVQAATQKHLSIRESVDFSLRRLLDLFIAQTLPLMILLILCGVVAVMGVLMAAPVLDVIGGAVYGIALALGFLIAFLAVGYVLGHPMLVPAVACESCSGPDAMQRAYAYVITRPLHLLWYWIVGLVGLALGFLAVSVVAALMLNATALLYGTLVSNPALIASDEMLELTRHTPAVPLDSWHHRWSAGLIGLWETLVLCLVAAYVLSYRFSASAIIYLLMRKAADGQDLQEIWQPGLIPGTLVAVPAGANPPASEPSPEPARGMAAVGDDA